jgi:quercetin dioxygenase-like cupin family protein/intracellular sulfur oxidation DsrE/DsrF family protein
MIRLLFVLAAGAFLGITGLTGARHDEKGEVKRSVLSAVDIAEKIGGKEAKATTVEVTIDPGQSSAPHRHPGPVFGYVVEGEYEWAIDDQPAKALKAGETFYEPTGCLHRVSKNPAAKGKTRVIAVVVHPRDAKQLTVPEKDSQPKAEAQPKAKTVTPVVEGYGAVVPYPDAAEQPAKGSKVVIDAAGVGKDAAQPLPGLVRAATLLNLAGASGLKASDLEIVVVLHGDATSAALDDAAYKALIGREHPHAEVMQKLKAAGVKFLVCGQALPRKGYDPRSVRGEVKVAASAVSAVVNLQVRGFAYVPAP